MNHQVYEKVKRTALKILSKRFVNATAIPEAPEKLDFGDVDFVIELSPSTPLPHHQVALDLGAKNIKNNHPT
ncbi:hypothetical protein KCU89_g17635, partial [Aureobasidium melanogenum]